MVNFQNIQLPIVFFKIMVRAVIRKKRNDKKLSFVIDLSKKDGIKKLLMEKSVAGREERN